MTSTQIEREIGRLLTVHKDVRKVLAYLLDKYSGEGTSPSALRSIIFFAIHAGSHREALELFSIYFRKRKKAPWPALIELLKRAKFDPDDKFIDYIFDAAAETESIDDLVLLNYWDKKDHRFIDYRERFIAELERKLSAQRHDLHAKIDYFKANRMIEEEKKAIDQLKGLFPDDEEIPALEAQLEHRWAIHVINRSQLQAKSEKLFSDGPTPLDTTEIKFVEILRSFCLEDCDSKVEKAYDYALMFLFMDRYIEALEVLQNAPPSPASQWLYVELLIRQKRFVDALNNIDHLEKLYAADPESTFAATYLRAICLHGLGQVNAGIELLESIVNIRPSYRAASSFLKDWQGGLT